MYTRYLNHPNQAHTMAIQQPKDQPKLRTNSLFPTFDTVDEAEAYACSRVPVSTHNEMYGLLQTYQNTMLKQANFSQAY